MASSLRTGFRGLTSLANATFSLLYLGDLGLSIALNFLYPSCAGGTLSSDGVTVTLIWMSTAMFLVPLDELMLMLLVVDSSALLNLLVTSTLALEVSSEKFNCFKFF